MEFTILTPSVFGTLAKLAIWLLGFAYYLFTNTQVEMHIQFSFKTKDPTENSQNL